MSSDRLHRSVVVVEYNKAAGSEYGEIDLADPGTVLQWRDFLTITLSLAAVGLVSFNTKMIEIIIALSILVLAIANMLPISTTHNLILIFAFGLFHGLGFASVMGDLQFRTVLMERILLLFNVGVEIGQLLIAVVPLQLLYLIRNHPRYHTYVVIPVSLISACIATYWVAQRAGLIA